MCPVQPVPVLCSFWLFYTKLAVGNAYKGSFPNGLGTFWILGLKQVEC